MRRPFYSVSLFYAISCIWCAEGASLSIRLDESFPGSVRGDLEVVARDVGTVVSEMFGQAQPPLLRPIVCSLGPPPPRTSVDDWFKPTQIRINITVRDRGYDQFAFQLGHELGHLFIGVYRSNTVFETVATAVSVEVLDRLAIRWQSKPPYASWANYSAAFRVYREENDRQALKRLGLSQDWKQRRIDLLKARVLAENELIEAQVEGISSERGRDLQTVGAMILRSEFFLWSNLIGLEACTNPMPSLMHSFAILPARRTCVQQRAPVAAWLVPGHLGRRSPTITKKHR